MFLIALDCTYYYPGLCAVFLPGAILQEHTCQFNHINVRIQPGTNLAPGWRVTHVD